ncbi:MULTISPECIES: tetratricopeptide repeat protein [Pseudomonas syringae group]|uniref:tetratricopeptide repeat protein n=1 Tax=Pseudomonas syringae group TaxID=136849 RepID=UPI000A72727F|nr:MULTISPECIES: tetratricopeptide repeat protein [Pseudomonas syringae group]
MSNLRFLVAGAVCWFLIAANCQAADLILNGAGDSRLNFSSWDEKSAVWKIVDFKKENLNFSLYNNAPDSSIGLGVNSDSMSSDGRYALVQRTIFGKLYDSEQVTETEKNYCDMVEMNSGCVLLSRSAEVCSGSWKGSIWSADGGEIVKPKLETINPQKLIESISTVRGSTLRADAIKEQMFMGVDSYASCYSGVENVQALNDLGFYLAQGGDDSGALRMYRRVESVGERTVLFLNIADSLWNTGKTSEAVKYYKKYADSMNASGKSNKVPSRVAERTK